MIKYCPLLITREEVKAVLVGQADYTVQKMRPCLKEECIAYSWGCCMHYGHERVETEGKEVQE